MTDCLRCGLPLDECEENLGALVHVLCPEDALDEAAILREAEGRRRD